MRVEPDRACVALFNLQMELIPLLEKGTQLLNDCCWLAEVSHALSIPALVVTHKKLGALSQALREVTSHATALEKSGFDFTRHEEIKRLIQETGCTQFILAGGETHVCLLQSALGLKALGMEVFLVEDATSARNRRDHRSGLRRLRENGIHLITKEMFFFECIGHSEFPDYLALAMRFLDGRYIR
jgi:hypothetical protein